ncbi:hypothetical protein ACN2WE_05410 [Streptomyces sp. cg28]|uniref:hypothetical protein n=1 Tax=Streptomyces sp. cg28 TaxID=3403457 RepID=UPI003B20D971
MKDDLLAALDATATFLNVLTWLWMAAPLIVTAFFYGLAAAVVLAAVHTIHERVRASFAGAHHTIADIQQPRKETP